MNTPDTHAGASRDEQVEAIFEEAMRAGMSDRAIVLDRLCAGDAGLRAEVNSLLSHAQETRDFLESPLLPGAGAMEMPLPEAIGPFKILGILGEGGMGCVYEAQQERPHRKVAIKMVRPDAISPGALRRFEREIETLGQLRHPCIAQLYEVGQHAQPGGRPLPYLVMELVRGAPLTKFAAANALSIPDRVRLLASIADAVQYAHQRGVVHRDLKPENILVERARPGEADATGTPENDTLGGTSNALPKILDFGIARLIDGSADAAQHTLAGQPMGTLAYMSPEQFAADPRGIDTRCDVYALGVIAYELFARARPFDVTGMSVVQAAKLVESVEPPLLGSIDRLLRGDIETIVARAMAKDRDRRYSTAAALADDLRRHLRDEPILARPPTTAYQLTKFASRHRGLVAGAAAAALILVAGLVVSTTLYVREQRAARKAADEAALSDAVRDYMIDGLLMAAAPDRMGYDVKMLEVLTKASDGLHERFKDHPEVEAQVRRDLGSVLGQLGKYPESVEQLKQCIPLLEKTVGPDHEWTVATFNVMSNSLGAQHKNDEELAAASEALTRARRGLPPGHTRTISAMNNVGAALHALGRVDEAKAILNEGLRLAEQSPKENVETIGTLLSQLVACAKVNGDKEAELALTRRSVEHVKSTVGLETEMGVMARNNLLNALSDSGKLDEAAALAVDLPAAAERVFPPGHSHRAHVYFSVSNVFLILKRFQEAERYALLAHATFVTAIGDPSWPVELAVEHVRKVYFKWPGHSAQLLEWSLRRMQARMMVSHPDELGTALKALEGTSRQCAAGGNKLTDQGLLTPLWQERDRLVPPGHPRRAAFLANFSLMCDAVEGCDLKKEAADLAVAALPDAKPDHDIAEQLVGMARDRAGR